LVVALLAGDSGELFHNSVLGELKKGHSFTIHASKIVGVTKNYVGTTVT
jgi:hypothetical protein